LKREGYRPSTIESNVKALKALSKNCDLNDPTGVKDAIARRNVCDGRKEVLSTFYKLYAEWKGIDFHAPRYRRIEKLPFIPLESEIDQMIGAFGKKTATFLMLLRDTGARAGEAWNLQWKSIDSNNRTVDIIPEKGSRPRKLTNSNVIYQNSGSAQQ